MKQKIKILYYNWTPFDNPRGFGGGVSIYIKNVIEEFIKHKDYDIFFLSSGYKYNPLKNKPYIKKSKNVYGKKCKTYEIINSSIIAPLGHLAWDINKYIDDDESLNIFKKFITKYGPFDVIHINNIGGIGQKVLTLKKLFPKTKFILDLHNYNSLCMNSYLFNHFKSELCEDFCNGENCLTCYSQNKIIEHLYDSKVKTYWQDNPLEKFLYQILNGFKNNYYNNWKNYYICDYSKSKSTAQSFKIFREKNIEYINENFDCILAVSNRVKEVAVKYGLDENKIIVSYIGTKFAEKQKQPQKINPDKKLKIAYLGYANILKGFFFLIESLQELSSDIAKNIDIVIAAKNADEKLLKNNLKNFNSISVYNGYTHENLASILQGVDLGIIPVLWEDNLPQVAIEMVSYGIPILCSNLGGASELTSSKEFIFSDKEELKEKIIKFANKREYLNKYWENKKDLTTLSQHFEFLNNIYKS